VKVNKRITVEGWVQNLFNKSYMARAIETSLQTGTESAYMGALRTYGSAFAARSENRA
jgi:iron complex outermembrane receptor protein